MAGEYLMTNLKRAETRRQAVLDWLNQHPGARMADIEAALPQFERLHLRGSVSSMVRLGEIDAEGRLKARRLTAVVAITTSAETMLEGKRLNSRKAHCKRVGKTLDEVRVRSSQPWRTVYREGDNPAIRAFNSGGQGAVRERTTINCHQLY